MKKHFSLISFLCSLFLFLLIGSCKHSVDPPKIDPPPSGYGRIAVCIAEDNTLSSDTRPVQSLFSARTAFPHAEFDSCKFIFTKVPDTVSELTPDSNGYFTLEIGNYTVELRAFIGNTLVASGVSEQFTVHEGDNDPVIVCLSPISGVAQGTFTYTVTYPAGAGAEITLELWDEMLDIPLSPTALSAGNGITETLNLDAASYLITVLVNKNGLYAGTTEAVHVYPLLTTNYTKHFNDDDFIALPTGPTEPEPPITSPINIIHYWVDQHGSLVTSNSAATVAAGETLAITAQGNGYTVRQWYLNGVPTGQNDSIYNFNSTAAGKHTVGLFVEKGGKLYNTNIFIIVEAAASTSTRTITIDMFDSGNNGWGNGAIRINVNGADLASVKVNSGSTNTYTFPVTTGDDVKLYWVTGTSQGENSFIAYYTNTPPNPAFDANNNTFWTGANALVYKLRNTMDNITNGELLGEFTVQ